MRALSFSLSAVALTLLTAAPGPWDGPSRDGPSRDDPSRDERPLMTSEPVEQEGAVQQVEGVPREFYFSRVAYSGYGRGYGRGRGRWATDYPKADQIFLSFIDRLLSNLDAYEREHPIRLDDPSVRRFPFLYALEVGSMALTEPEIVGLRDYLLAGGHGLPQGRPDLPLVHRPLALERPPRRLRA